MLDCSNNRSRGHSNTFTGAGISVVLESWEINFSLESVFVRAFETILDTYISIVPVCVCVLCNGGEGGGVGGDGGGGGVCVFVCV